MLATNLNVVGTVNGNRHSRTREASLGFLATFRQRNKPSINLKSESIGPNEPAYVLTELPDGKFRVYGIECARVRDNKTAFTEEERKAIIDALPFAEEFVSIERGFNFEADEDSKEITVLLGSDWLFAIWVDEENQTFMIERNEYLVRDCDIAPMIRMVGIAFRQAQES